jgi:hypothetical protein
MWGPQKLEESRKGWILPQVVRGIGLGAEPLEMGGSKFFFFFEAKTSWWQFVTEVLGQEFKLYMHLELSPHKHPDR